MGRAAWPPNRQPPTDPMAGASPTATPQTHVCGHGKTLRPPLRPGCKGELELAEPSQPEAEEEEGRQ